jgi:hypothetical protein
MWHIEYACGSNVEYLHSEDTTISILPWEDWVYLVLSSRGILCVSYPKNKQANEGLVVTRLGFPLIWGTRYLSSFYTIHPMLCRKLGNISDTDTSGLIVDSGEFQFHFPYDIVLWVFSFRKYSLCPTKK